MSLEDDFISLLPVSSQDWCKRLIQESDEKSLNQFLMWHSKESLLAVFSWVPPWPPASWLIFLQHGIPDWSPIVRRITTYLPPSDILALRKVAQTIIAETSSPLHAAYQVFAWVSQNITWAPVWGAATPLEILSRKEGGSIHFAQLFSTLLRSIFIPTRIIEEVALVPESWIKSFHTMWADTPRSVRSWLGESLCYHPLCEVYVNGHWVPVDPQRSQFGKTEIMQHYRTPDLLKVVVRTWEDYGRYINREDVYLDEAYGICSEQQKHLELVSVINEIRKNTGVEIEQSGMKLSWLNSALHDLSNLSMKHWQTISENSDLTMQSVPEYNEVIEIFFRAAAPLPIKITNCPTFPQKGETRILIGKQLKELVNTEFLANVARGCRILAFYEPWGEAEKYSREVFALFDIGCLGWIYGPGSDCKPMHVAGNGIFSDVSNFANILDMQFVWELKPSPQTESILTCVPQSEGSQPAVTAVAMKHGKGVVVFAPLSFAARANPYGVDYLSGCHRRLMNFILVQPQKLNREFYHLA